MNLWPLSLSADISIISKNKSMSIVPSHLGLIIDGNRRWAKEKGLPSFEGHRRGFENLEKIGDLCLKKGVKILTAYCFSVENWKRSEEEVSYLMNLLFLGLDKYTKKCIKNDVQMKVIGQKEKLSKKLQKKIKDSENITKDNKKGILNLAISYGGRAEIVEALKSIKDGEITEDAVNNSLWTAGQPDPDLIIRTGGEKRLSGFLTWQSVYSELYFTDTYWPDFNEQDLEQAFEEYLKRSRRFGK